MRSLLMLYQDKNLPSSRVRVLNLVSDLRSHGIKVITYPYPRTLAGKLKVVNQLRRFEVVFLQKKLVTWLDLHLIRHFAAKVVFDFDDAIYIRDDKASDPFSQTRHNRFIRIIRAVDGVIAGNPILADFAKNYSNRPVAILPSSVPANGVPTKDWNRKNERPIIGWIGSGGNLHHLELITPSLQQLARKVDYELRVISDTTFTMKDVRVVNVPWQEATQEREIAAFDIGIMPMPKNRWTAGKCSYKLLQYMAAGIPVVATDWGFNCEVVKDGESGYLASDGQDFFDSLERLINSPEQARRMGEKGRNIVLAGFSVEIIAKRLLHILNEL